MSQVSIRKVVRHCLIKQWAAHSFLQSASPACDRSGAHKLWEKGDYEFMTAKRGNRAQICEKRHLHWRFVRSTRVPAIARVQWMEWKEMLAVDKLAAAHCLARRDFGNCMHRGTNPSRWGVSHWIIRSSDTEMRQLYTNMAMAEKPTQISLNLFDLISATHKPPPNRSQNNDAKSIHGCVVPMYSTLKWTLFSKSGYWQRVPMVTINTIIWMVCWCVCVVRCTHNWASIKPIIISTHSPH